MLANRSIPAVTVIPELAYADVGEAVEWLCQAFGFSLRLRIANHRAQLKVGNGALVVRESHVTGPRPPSGCSVMVRVEDVDAHYARALQHGARIVLLPADYPYGERQYSAQDFAGHSWTFSQSIADVDPRDWGGVPGQL